VEEDRQADEGDGSRRLQAPLFGEVVVLCVAFQLVFRLRQQGCLHGLRDLLRLLQVFDLQQGGELDAGIIYEPRREGEVGEAEARPVLRAYSVGVARREEGGQTSPGRPSRRDDRDFMDERDWDGRDERDNRKGRASARPRCPGKGAPRFGRAARDPSPPWCPGEGTFPAAFSSIAQIFGEEGVGDAVFSSHLLDMSVFNQPLFGGIDG